MSTLWNPRKPLNQPPHYRRGAAREIRADPAVAAAIRSIKAAQFARDDARLRHGNRATVRG